METLDSQSTVYAAGLEPITEIHPFAIDAMNEIGIDMKIEQVHSPNELVQTSFDYLITLCEGTREEYKGLQLDYGHKLHLGFDNPETQLHKHRDKIEAYRDLRDEIHAELHYFYHRILTKKAAK